ELSATLKMAETYYTRNGLPIDVDPYWEYDTRYEIRADTGEWHKYYVSKGETTAKLHYYREPRFYAHLGFDRSIYELSSLPEAESVVIKNRSGEQFGVVFQDCHISTGYFIKKMVHLNTSTTTAGYNNIFFPMPLIRLADLYLLYAEALNEIKDTPDGEVYRWVDSIRIRAGLNTVLESWRWAKPENMNDPYDKEKMREIIKRERLIELAFEGQRPFDLRRWRDAEKYLNEPVRGWDFQGSKIDEYYLTRVYFSNRRFTYKDYLWPLRNSTLIVNSNLVQNPGW
ncbi:MAG: RagB/SusD family nutrient uptake outer membrane protein, partial [Tannerella sp.]|nr:RagB/SusD family nutrient uptake outer membrane protein [Tannerella sp.]